MLVFSTMPSQGHNKLFENIPEWSIFYHSHPWPLSVLFFSSTWQHCSNLLSCFAGGDLNYLIVSVIGTTNQHRRQLFIKTILTWLSHTRNNFQLLSTSPFAGKTKQIIANKSWMICYQAILIIWALLAFSLHFFGNSCDFLHEHTSPAQSADKDCTIWKLPELVAQSYSRLLG